MIRLFAAVAALLAPVGLVAALPAPAHAGQVGVTVGIEGAGSVRVVEGTLEDLAPSTCSRYDNQDHRVTVWCSRFRNEEPFEAWVWLRPTPSPSPAGQWQFSGWTGCDTTRTTNGVTECAVHSGAFGSVEKSPVAHFQDVGVPTVTVSATQVVADDRTFQFDFTATDGATLCRIEGEASFSPCTSPVRRSVPEGRRVFQVRAVDGSGNAGTAQVDIVSIDTEMTFGPMAVSRDRTAVIGLATIGGEKFWCSLDGEPFTYCGSGPRRSVVLEYLDDGFHRLRVYASTGDWVDPIPAEWWWTVDSTGPTTPTVVTSDVRGNSATFTFTNPEATSFRCRIDSPAGNGMWGSCSSPVVLGDLEQGVHRLAVQGMDSAGNIESPGASYEWTVDTTGEPEPEPEPEPGPGPVPGPGPEPEPEPTSAPVPTSGPAPAPSPTAAPLPVVGQVTSSTSARWKLVPGRRGKVAVRVLAAAVPTGRVVVRDRGKVIARGRLTAARSGRLTLVLPRLRPGRHTLVVAYLGSEQVSASRSQAVRKRTR